MHKQTVSIAVNQESHVMMASMSMMKLAKKMGMSPVDCTLCATVVSELATNIVRYAENGEIILCNKEDSLHVIAKDRGPGIANIELAMQEGHSGGDGLGMGLSGVARIMDSMDITSIVNQGTTVTVSKSLRRKKPPDPILRKTIKPLDTAILCHPYLGERVSGDGALILDIPAYKFLALWDVSGHGKEAHELSTKVEGVVRYNCEKPPPILLHDLHEKFRGTRGLGAVIARLSLGTGWVEYEGIGNSALLHLHERGMRRLPLQEGVIGYQIRTPKLDRFQLHQGQSLIMHSDGIRTMRDELTVFQNTSAAQIAKKILSDFRSKQADDASCLVLRY